MDRERAAIDAILARVPHPPTPAGPGDDAAIDGGRAVTTDLLIEGTHFVRAHPPAWLGWKSLAVNLSDVAAMGAVPESFTLGLGLPRAWPSPARDAWIAAFADGLGECARASAVALVGGDTVATGDGITIAITAFGRPVASAEPPQWLRRDRVAVGDRIFALGDIGRAGCGLARWLDGLAAGRDVAELVEDVTVRAQLRPEPPLWAGPWALQAGARVGMDLSDGLATDLPRLARASGVTLAIDLAALPDDPALAPRLGERPLGPVERACLGEDYGLLVAVRPTLASHFAAKGFIDLGEAVHTPPGEAPGQVHWSVAGTRIASLVPAFSHFPDSR